jgi:hypothetical protein
MCGDVVRATVWKSMLGGRNSARSGGTETNWSGVRNGAARETGERYGTAASKCESQSKKWAERTARAERKGGGAESQRSERAKYAKQAQVVDEMMERDAANERDAAIAQ